jgi:hypothetical protein
MLPPQDPRSRKISPEQAAMQKAHFPKETDENSNEAKDEQKQKLNKFLRALGTQKTDTASQKPNELDNRQKNNALRPDTLNSKRSKDNIGVLHGIDSSNGQITGKLVIEQKRRGNYDIRKNIEMVERLNQRNRKLTDNYMKDRGVDPNEFQETGKKLYDLLKADLDGKSVSTIDYEIAHKKFSRMLNKLDI